MNNLTPNQIHDAKVFYRFFNRIPEEKWCRNYFFMGNQRCVLGHLGVITRSDLNPSAQKLISLFRAYDRRDPADINNSTFNMPKQNILNHLKKMFSST